MNYVEAFKIIEQVDDIVQFQLLVPCEVETYMLCTLLLVDSLHLIELCYIVQDGRQLRTFIHHRLELGTVVVCWLSLGGWALSVVCDYSLWFLRLL